MRHKKKRATFRSKFAWLFKFYSKEDLLQIVFTVVDEIEYRREFRNGSKVYLAHLISPRKKTLCTSPAFISTKAVDEALGVIYNLAINKQKHLKKITEL